MCPKTRINKFYKITSEFEEANLYTGKIDAKSKIYLEAIYGNKSFFLEFSTNKLYGSSL